MAETYTIKPLEWEKNGEHWKCKTSIGVFQIFRSDALLCSLHLSYGCISHGIADATTISQLKRKAWTYYRRQMKTALEPCQPAQAET